MPSDRVDRISELVERLIKQDEMYESFLHNSPWGLLVVDRTFHIVFVNKTFERMSGYSVEEVRGKHLQSLMPKEDRARHTEHEKEYVKQPHDREGNHGLKPLLVHKNGTKLRVEISLATMTISGGTYFAASIRNLGSLFNTVEGREKGSE